MPVPLLKLRPYQQTARSIKAGIAAMVQRRQSGKSHVLGAIGLEWMMEAVCSVLFMSAALRLGMENIRKEADIWREVTQKMRVIIAQNCRKTPDCTCQRMCANNMFA